MNTVDKMMKKRAQVTVWIIIAILIVGALLVIFYPRIREGVGRIFIPSPPNVKVEECVDDYVEGAVDLVSRQGGSISPENSILYEDNNIGALNGTLGTHCLTDTTEVTIFGLYYPDPTFFGDDAATVAGDSTQTTAITQLEA